jgi:hypothetical protein
MIRLVFTLNSVTTVISEGGGGGEALRSINNLTFGAWETNIVGQKTTTLNLNIVNHELYFMTSLKHFTFTNVIV